MIFRGRTIQSVRTYIKNRLGLIYQIPNDLPKLLHPSDTRNCKAVGDEIPTFEFSSAASEWRLTKDGARYLFLDSSFKNINILTWSHTASHTSADDSLDTDFEVNNWIIEANQPPVLDDLAASLSTLEL